MADTTTHKFGIISNGASATGLVVQSCNKDENVEIAEARNEQGRVAELKAYSKGTTYSVTGLVKDGESETTVMVGSTVTIDNLNLIVESVSKQETNTGFVQVTMTCRTADSATITTYGS